VTKSYHPDSALPAALHTEALEARVALRMTVHLHRAAQGLPHEITERLRFGREQALAAARRQRAAAVVLPQLVGVGEPARRWATHPRSGCAWCPPCRWSCCWPGWC